MEPKTKLVSVIIPIYNVAKYIEHGVRSVMKQDYTNIEIILVDDGSPDNSGAIIDKLATEDPRIRVFHKKNGGVSSARNYGLANANGEYVTFVDGDDWVDENYVSYFVELIESQKCSVGVNKNNYTNGSERSSTRTYQVQSEKVIEWIYRGDVFVAVWNKIYSTAFLRENNLSFDEKIWFGDGMLFNIDCLQHLDTVAVGEKCVYHQVDNPDSAMRKFNLQSRLCGIDSLEIQKRHWKRSNKKIERAWLYHRRAYNRAILCGLVANNLETTYRKIFAECVRNLRCNLSHSLLIKRPLKEKLWYICAFINPYVMAKREKRKILRQIRRRK